MKVYNPLPADLLIGLFNLVDQKPQICSECDGEGLIRIVSHDPEEGEKEYDWVDCEKCTKGEAV